MSNYIKVLKRIERERVDKQPPVVGRLVEKRLAGAPLPTAPANPMAPILRAVGGRGATAAASDSLPAETSVTVPESLDVGVPIEAAGPASSNPRLQASPLSPEASKGVATLFDKLRTLPSSRPTRILIFCGASNAEHVDSVASSLAAHAERHGMNVLIATLVGSGARAKVTPLRTKVDGSLSDARSLPVDLTGSPETAAMDAWIKGVAPTADLVIIDGPPLADSIDAALLARWCDGLVIVAETEVTDRAALRSAAERAHVAGCHTLGVVMAGGKSSLPEWMRRLLGGGPQ